MKTAKILNWKEIELILQELDIINCRIQEVHQPTYDTLVFKLYRPGKSLNIFFSFNPHNCRMHLSTIKIKNPPRPYRFAVFLRANILYGKLINIEQVAKERIIKIDIEKENRKLILWVRLWTGAANMIVTDEKRIILDSHFRRPKRNEITGYFYNLEQSIKNSNSTILNKYQIRDLPGKGTFNQKIEKHFLEIENQAKKQYLLEKAIQSLNAKENRLNIQLEKLKKSHTKYQNPQRFKQIGDIIISALNQIKKGEKWLKTFDFYNNQEIEIQLQQGLTPAENAEYYYKKYKKAKNQIKYLKQDISQLKVQIDEINAKKNSILQETSLNKLENLIIKTDKSENLKNEDNIPGIKIHSNNYLIIIGKTAQENALLLRKHMKGNDYWFHVRDYPGAYVFIKSKRNKSIPLEVMLDAANLAILHSKARQSGKGDVYYTQVKYLKKPKNSPLGLVLPTREKNLFIKLDAQRLKTLKDDKSIEIKY